MNRFSEGVTSRVRSMTVLLMALVAIVLGQGPTAQAAFEFEKVGVSLTDSNGRFSRQAGAHPDFTFSFEVPSDPSPVIGGEPAPPGPIESAHSVDLDLPLGFVGNPTGIATCDFPDLANPGGGGAKCPTASQVGSAHVKTVGQNFTEEHTVAIYNMVHGPDVPARFGFNVLGVVNVIDARVRPGDYGISSGSFALSQAEAVRAADITFWGVPADPRHDALRHPGDLEPPQSTDAPRVPFLSAPTSCSQTPVSFTARGDTWEHLGIFDTRVLAADIEGTPLAFEGCERLAFGPSVDVAPLSTVADAPTGLSVKLEVPQADDPEGFATAHLRKVVMTLPQGMSVSASSAAGLGACSLSEIGLGSGGAPTCPDSSKIGTVRLDTPVLDEQLQGDVILAKQNENPFGSLLALYIAIKGPGIYIKLPGKIDADPDTGQLTATFDDNPQLPFERLQLDLKGGPRAPLTTPSKCGTYTAKTVLTPWSGTPPVELSTPIKVDQGCNTGGFDPKLNAGTLDATGGSFSPFILRITRSDGEPNLSAIRATLPPGLLAKLKGVALCGDAQAVSGNCPATSQVGKVTVGAGSGPTPLYVPEAGKAPTAAYLAGPYKGAPYSMVVKVPAQAGPFDLGTVTVRNALNIDPTTAQVTAVSDPLPQILQGIPIAYRDVRVEVNRPEFTINPTSCKPMKVTSILTSATGQSASPSSGFQATDCGELDFGPSLKLAFKGKMSRTGNPAVHATLKAAPGEANIAKTTVVLPKSQFIDNAHINNPCTRVQFNAGACPASSILGQATAYTPLLDQPLSGPIYFRSNGGERELPDLVADLNGQIHVTLVGFIDSKNGGVRTRFQNVPDAPVSKFVLKLKGGKKGLIENSRDLCSFTPKAKVQMTGQNGKPNDFAAKIATSCGKAKRKK